MLSIAQLVTRTEAEGPGIRLAIWLQGCSIRCAGCCNPEMFERGGKAVTAQEVVALARGADGITLLGGEPVDQPEAVTELAALAQAAGLSVVLFSGYPKGQIIARAPALLASVDVLVDQPYLAGRPEPRGGRRWIGSANQGLHFLTTRYGPTDFVGPNTVELRLTSAGATVNGWPTR